MSIPHSKKLLGLIVLVIAVIPAAAQAGRTPRKTPKPTASVSPLPSPTPDAAPAKKNEGKANSRPDKGPIAETKSYTPTYFYTFNRPGFAYSRILIEHDEAGRGQISMQRDDSNELFTDPLQLSSETLSSLKAAFTELNFLDSTEDYQYAGHDYSHLGNITITRKAGGNQRTAKFNWTENKSAKILMDEYRRISNEYTVRADLASARENQPLLTPGLIETLDGYLQRNEISDPPHIIPFLTELSQDERIPLMGRNRLGRMIERIQKAKKH